MASLEHYYTRFEETGIYHVYNRCIDRQPLFRSADNYAFFLRRLDFYIRPVADILAYCLLGNHFHLCIRIKPLEEMGALTTRSKPDALVYVGTPTHMPAGTPAPAPAPAPDLTTFTKLSNLAKMAQKSPHDIVTHQFRKLFQSYAMAYNKQHSRVGTLFQTPFKRALVVENEYLRNLILYIHQNPQQHQLIDNFRDWNWSSFHSIMFRKKRGITNTQLTLEMVGGLQEFLFLHQNPDNILQNQNWAKIIHSVESQFYPINL